jgi:hypothetical protein
MEGLKRNFTGCKFKFWLNENELMHESWESGVCMRVFSTLMPSQTRTRVAWELTGYYRRYYRLDITDWIEPVQSWWELMRVGCQRERELHLSCPVKQEQELHESWLDITARVAKTLINSHQNLNQFKVDESWWELAVNASESCTSHQLSLTLILVWPRL